MTDQKTFLTDAQRELGIGSTEMAALLRTSIHTYRAWLYGKRPMPGVALVAVELLLEKKAHRII